MVPAPLRAPVHVQRRGPVQGVLLVSTNPCKARCEKTRKVFELYCQQNAVLKKFTANCSLYSVLVLAVCTPVCANSGTCSSPGTCTCTSSWTGSRCATRKYQQIEIGIPKEKRSFHIIFLKKLFSLFRSNRTQYRPKVIFFNIKYIFLLFRLIAKPRSIVSILFENKFFFLYLY